MSRQTCPICGEALVAPSGPTKSPIILFGEFPGRQEMAYGRPWIGEAGRVLQTELARAHINMDACRITNLWLHYKSKDEKELAWHLAQLKEELKGRKAALLMGSEVSNLFLGRVVSAMTGLQVQSKLLPKSIKVAVAVVNPAVTLQDGGTIGEVRLAIERFAELTKELR